MASIGIVLQLKAVLHKLLSKKKRDLLNIYDPVWWARAVAPDAKHKDALLKAAPDSGRALMSYVCERSKTLRADAAGYLNAFNSYLKTRPDSTADQRLNAIGVMLTDRFVRDRFNAAVVTYIIELLKVPEPFTKADVTRLVRGEEVKDVRKKFGKSKNLIIFNVLRQALQRERNFVVEQAFDLVRRNLSSSAKRLLSKEKTKTKKKKKDKKPKKKAPKVKPPAPAPAPAPAPKPLPPPLPTVVSSSESEDEMPPALSPEKPMTSRVINDDDDVEEEAPPPLSSEPEPEVAPAPVAPSVNIPQVSKAVEVSMRNIVHVHELDRTEDAQGNDISALYTPVHLQFTTKSMVSVLANKSFRDKLGVLKLLSVTDGYAVYAIMNDRRLIVCRDNDSIVTFPAFDDISEYTVEQMDASVTATMRLFNLETGGEDDPVTATLYIVEPFRFFRDVLFGEENEEEPLSAMIEGVFDSYAELAEVMVHNNASIDTVVFTEEGIRFIDFRRATLASEEQELATQTWLQKPPSPQTYLWDTFCFIVDAYYAAVQRDKELAQYVYDVFVRELEQEETTVMPSVTTHSLRKKDMRMRLVLHDDGKQDDLNVYVNKREGIVAKWTEDVAEQRETAKATAAAAAAVVEEPPVLIPSLIEVRAMDETPVELTSAQVLALRLPVLFTELGTYNEERHQYTVGALLARFALDWDGAHEVEYRLHAKASALGLATTVAAHAYMPTSQLHLVFNDYQGNSTMDYMNSAISGLSALVESVPLQAVRATGALVLSTPSLVRSLFNVVYALTNAGLMHHQCALENFFVDEESGKCLLTAFDKAWDGSEGQPYRTVLGVNGVARAREYHDYATHFMDMYAPLVPSKTFDGLYLLRSLMTECLRVKGMQAQKVALWTLLHDEFVHELVERSEADHSGARVSIEQMNLYENDGAFELRLLYEEPDAGGKTRTLHVEALRPIKRS